MKDRLLRPDRIDLKPLGAPMKKRSLFLAAAAVLLVLGVGAPKAQAGTLLSLLLGMDVKYGGLVFTFDAWTPTGSAPTADNVSVTFETVGGEVGFNLSGTFSAAAGSTSDGDLRFHVSGAPITDATLTANSSNPSNNIHGQASVTETIHGGNIL